MPSIQKFFSVLLAICLSTVLASAFQEPLQLRRRDGRVVTVDMDDKDLVYHLCDPETESTSDLCQILDDVLNEPKNCKRINSLYQFSGLTPLGRVWKMEGRSSHKAAISQVLLEHGADPFIVQASGSTPFDQIIESSSNDTVSLVRLIFRLHDPDKFFHHGREVDDYIYERIRSSQAYNCLSVILKSRQVWREMKGKLLLLEALAMDNPELADPLKLIASFLVSLYSESSF